MAPDADSSAAFDAISDGRHSLRLVKLRLGLTLIAVAILPVAALAPMIRTIMDDPRVPQRERLTTQAEHVAAQLEREFSAVRSSLAGLGSGTVVPGVLDAKAGDKEAAGAVAALDSLVAGPDSFVTSVAVVDAAGIVHAEAGVGHVPSIGLPLTELEPTPVRVNPGSAEVPASMDVAVLIEGEAGAPPRGLIVASVSVVRLLEGAAQDLEASGSSVSVVADGSPIAEIVTSGTAAGQATPVIELSADPSSINTGSAPVQLPDLSGWSIVASAPLTIVSLPVPAVATLTALLVLLAVAAWWMGRGVLAPAAALDAQRVRFQELYELAREASLRDSLTGLGNHRAFQEAVARMVDQTRRYGNTFSLILIDIDEFKRVNDSRGHAIGDDLLAEVGELIRSTIRTSDTGFRIGGDEFALLLPETDLAGAEVLARRILTRGLEDRSGGRYRAPISFSAGITACPQFGTTRVELTGQADAALYRGKRAGRTIVETYDPEQDRGHVDEGMRAELSAAVSSVIESGALTPVYQPIIHLPTGRILGYEGLVRADPRSGFPHTGALFDAAEIAGRVLDLDRAALEVVLRGAADLPHETLLSVNVSPRSFEAPEFNATVFLAILRRHGIAPERVIMELTERDAVRDAAQLRSTILALQAAGVRVAADDVGAGNAGLRLLSQFQFDVVKIDLSLVQGGTNHDQTLSVLGSLVDLARRWGALTIAEGVETAVQLQMIRELGVEAAQGYLLGRPGPSLDLETIDLDALVGPVPVTTAAYREPAPEAPRFSLPTPVPSASFVSPTREPTAASVIAAGHTSSPFGRR